MPVATAIQLNRREARIGLGAHEEQLVAALAPSRLYVHVPGKANSDSGPAMIGHLNRSHWIKSCKVVIELKYLA